MGKRISVRKVHPAYRYTDFIPYPTRYPELWGENTVAVSLWNLLEGEMVELGLEWVVLGLYESSMSSRFESDELRPGWETSRLEYA